MSHAPQQLRLRDQGRELVVVDADAEPLALSAEYLRVFSPSAEVQGHGLIEPQLVGGKRAVTIKRIEPVGRYAVRLHFSDGHDTGLYAWDTLREMAAQHDKRWARYLERLEAHGMSRDEDVIAFNALRPRK